MRKTPIFACFLLGLGLTLPPSGAAADHPPAPVPGRTAPLRCAERPFRAAIRGGQGEALPASCRSGPAATLATDDEVTLSPVMALVVGRRIWKNECLGTIAGLTSWNRGEGFPSLGIGHFIWYPAGKPDRFQEAFPALLAFLRERGVALPAWLAAGGPCPWPTREAFLADRRSPRLTELRRLLAGTIPLQVGFIARRLAAALPQLTAALPPADRPAVVARFRALQRTPEGLFALLDYVNFKGEGVKETERYQGQGWGLLQVLQEMPGQPQGAAAVEAFADAARRVLARRVANAPAARRDQEAAWLPGWHKRVDRYTGPLVTGK
ncbi:MAG: hypothetical protein GX442_09915 [Candidatus Riflebacteria bacterium]|nr:hypothetical protein [Candidatus Riflebacteria bacterium]